MKVRRPDAAKAANQLRRQHTAAADRVAQLRRSAPSGFYSGMASLGAAMRAANEQSTQRLVALADAMREGIR